MLYRFWGLLDSCLAADVNIDWTALARYTFNDMQTYELGAARKTRSPNLYERFAWSRGAMAMFMNNWVGDGNGYVGDINLKPEVAHTVSATANWHDAKQEDWETKITPFYTHVENYIDARLCQPGNGVTCTSPSGGFNFLQLANFDAHLFGVDVSGSKLLLETGKYGNLYQQMPFNATVALEHKRGGWSNTIETQLVASKTDVQSVRVEPKTAGYALLSLRSSYTWKHLRIDGGIDNLLDKNYALPLGGTYIGGKKRYRKCGSRHGALVQCRYDGQLLIERGMNNSYLELFACSAMGDRQVVRCAKCMKSQAGLRPRLRGLNRNLIKLRYLTH